MIDLSEYDPDVTLTVARKIADEIIDTQSDLDNPAYDLALTFRTLDRGALGGRSLPTDWLRPESRS